jgi:membrane dipeptidase
MHVCVPRALGSDLAASLEEYRSAGISMVAANVSDAGYSLEQAIRTIAMFRAQIAARADIFRFVQDVDDIEDAVRTKRLGLCFDVEGALLLGEQIDAVRVLYDLGVRWMAFAYNRKNAFASGCHDRDDEGLTPLGRELVLTMDAVGMIKDCAHTGYRSAMDVLSLSAKPCIVSHANPRALTDHPRNVPDELMKAVAQTGGVMGLTGVNIFLGAQMPSVDDLFRHIDYAVNLIGAEHVGIGLDHAVRASSDLTEYLRDKTYWPEGFGYDRPIAILGPDIFAPLEKRMRTAGYPESAIRGVLGENFRRVAAQVWKAPSF